MRLALDPVPDCQFPLWGDGRPSHVYCGAPARPGSSYCRRHHDRCWTPAPPLKLPPLLPAAEANLRLSLLSGGMA